MNVFTPYSPFMCSSSEVILKKPLLKDQIGNTNIQLFRERLSEKVHGTIPKGIVGGLKCNVLQRNWKKWHGRPRTYVC